MLCETETAADAAAASLRAEAKLLAMAGTLLLAAGFPLTLALAALSLASGRVEPLTSVWAGAPLIVFGWVSCALASRRLQQARRVRESAAPAA
jgi:hypothetical protein